MGTNNVEELREDERELELYDLAQEGILKQRQRHVVTTSSPWL